MRLKLTAPNRSPSSVRVWIDDVEITSDVIGISVDFSTDDFNRAVLTISPGELELDGDVIAMVEAHVQRQEEAVSLDIHNGKIGLSS